MSDVDEGQLACPCGDCVLDIRGKKPGEEVTCPSCGEVLTVLESADSDKAQEKENVPNLDAYFTDDDDDDPDEFTDASEEDLATDVGPSDDDIASLMEEIEADQVKVNINKAVEDPKKDKRKSRKGKKKKGQEGDEDGAEGSEKDDAFEEAPDRGNLPFIIAYVGFFVVGVGGYVVSMWLRARDAGGSLALNFGGMGWTGWLILIGGSAVLGLLLWVGSVYLKVKQDAVREQKREQARERRQARSKK